MHKVILVLILAITSGNAIAEWVQVGKGDVSTAYADPATIRNKGNKVKMWSLLDFNAAKVTPEGKPYLSQRELWEYDCENEAERIIAFSTHSSGMGGGVTVDHISSSSAKWEPVSPESVGEALWKFACRKR